MTPERQIKLGRQAKSPCLSTPRARSSWAARNLRRALCKRFDGLFGLAALVQVCATLPNNFIAFEYPIGKPDWWHQIVEGLPDPIVKDGFIDVDAWTRPGIGLDFNIPAARAHLREDDRDFFD